MANAATNTRYGANTTYGSLAYDFNNPALYPEERREVYREGYRERKVIIPAPPKIDEDARVLTKVKTRQSVAPLAIIGYACAAVLLIFSLMAKIQLTEVTDQSVRLEEKLTELDVAQSRLLIDYESAFNRTEIEEYATSRLGMQHPRSEQVFYLDSAVPDKAIVLDGSTTKNGIGDRIFDMLASIGEYFK